MDVMPKLTTMNRLTKGFLFLSIIILTSCHHSTKTAEIKTAPSKVVDRGTAKITWVDWSDENFAKAKSEHKLLILDLEAVWCHWCHVMEKETYANPRVIELLQSHFVSMKVDQDARPDLSNRYEDYGWPATIIFDADGHELVKNQGYIDPESMLDFLNEVIKNPRPQTVKKNTQPLQTPDTKAWVAMLQKSYLDDYDVKQGGWGTDHKYLDSGTIEYALFHLQDQADAKNKVTQTLQGVQHITDPEWGGLYQYSTDGDWVHPHFEKIMFYQSEGIRIFSEAYAFLHNDSYLKCVEKIYRYMNEFLRNSDGVYFVSQDADVVEGEHAGEYFLKSDSERRKIGIPRIDNHIYARENGWAIRALATYARVTGKQSALTEAIVAANWIKRHRAIDGGFRHDERDKLGDYVGDSLAMGEAFLELYANTGNRTWLYDAQHTMTYILKNFKNRNGLDGFITSKKFEKNFQPIVERDENIRLGSFANLLFHYTGNKEYKDVVVTIEKYLRDPEIALAGWPGNLLLFHEETLQDPLHLTVVGSKSDSRSKKLFAAAIRYPSIYRRIEWKDPKEGALPNPDVDYPVMDQPAGFICTNHACSAPVFDPKEFVERITQITKN